MRLIDADVLKQHIDKLPALPDGNFAGNHSALKALINMQPTIELEPHWIPVSERLPKKKGYYLVTRKNPKGYVTRISYDPSRVERGVYNSPWGNGDADVLAWMELPKPYEVKGK